MAKEKARSKHFLLVKRIVITILIMLPLFLLIIPIYNLTHQHFIIFPAKNLQDKLLSFTDRGFNGTSVIDYFSYAEGVMDLRYTLREGSDSPMVFTILYMNTSEQPFDVSRYNSVSIKIKESTNKKILIFMKTFVPGISRPGGDNAITLRHNSYTLKLFPGVHEYTINFDEFETPQWWLSTMQVPYSDLPVEDFSKLISFDMQFNEGEFDTMLNIPQRAVIGEIVLNRDFSFSDGLILGCLGFFYSGLGVFLIVRRIMISRHSMPKQNSLHVQSYREQDLTRVREFIKAHYNEPDISTRMLYKSLGIPPEKVFSLVVSEYGLTFKQLINRMRIEEAKRLLGESDLRITDIAMCVGYNELTYFNRLFKKYVKMTPSDFRDKALSK